NVAGYDVSRLMAGARGTLGVITEISFKVLPRPAADMTLAYEMAEAQATEQVNRWAGLPLPVSATAWQDGRLRVRISGAPASLSAAKARMGGEEVDAGDYWRDLREHRLPFFQGASTLWRVSVPQTAAPLGTHQAPLIEWGGGLRWIAGSDVDAMHVRTSTERAGGHATAFRGGRGVVPVFHPLKPASAKIHRRLKAAFDPAGILNPGRMYDF